MIAAPDRRTVGALVALAAASIHLAALAAAQRPDPMVDEPQRFLRTVGGFSQGDLQRLDRGEAVAKLLDTDRREIATVGAIRISAPRARLLERYRDISTLRGSNIVLQLGTFAAAPRAQDLGTFTPEDYDLETIRDCKPGDCGVRLSAETMSRFNREVNWGAADWKQQAGSLWRTTLAEYAAAYRATGALGDYRNKATPLSVKEEFDLLFEESRYFAATAPEFFGYLQGFPRVRLAGAEDLLYWAKDDIGLRPITSITHQALYTPPSSGAARPPAFIGTKQIYATHYFDAALGLTMAFDDGGSGFYMVCINRARTRSLQSFTRAMVRSIVQRRSRDATEKMLLSTKTALERGR
jgi:hypothetical protein